MIKHIIMFKFTDIKNDFERIEIFKKMQASFGPLKSKIDVIKSYEVGINSKATNFSYDLVITSEYDSWEDLEIYIKHSEHQKAINACADIKKEKAVVDYEY